MEINLYLANLEKEINDIKYVIELCEETNNLDKIKTLEYFLKEMESNFNEPKFIKEKFIPELSKIKGYKGVIIFESSVGNYFNVDILIDKINTKTENKIQKDYEIFGKESDLIFGINIHEYDSYDFDEWENYDCLKCLVDE